MCATAKKLKKTIKSAILGGSRSFKVIDVNTIKKLVTSACYEVLCYVMSMSICNCFHAKRANRGKITNFLLQLSLTIAGAGLLKPRELRHGLLKSAFNAENFICRLFLVYLQPLRCNSLLKCVSQAEIAKNSPKTPLLGLQGHSSLSILINLKSPSP